MLTGSAPPEACGVGDYSQMLVSSLAASDYPVELLCWKRWDFAGTAELIRRLSRDKDALLHIQYPTFGYGHSLGPQICSLAKPGVVTLHEFSLAHPLRKASLLPFTLRARHLVMTSEFEKAALTSRMPWAAAKISTIPIGSNIPTTRRVTSPQMPLRVLYHGLIMPRKGLEEFLALAQLARVRNAPWRFIVCGKIPESHAEYGRAIMQASRVANVQWILNRSQDEVAELFREGGIAYLPFVDGASERRGSLKAVLASGLPTVTTSSTQTTETLRDAVVIADNSEAAFESIRQLSASPEAQQRLIEAALRYAKSFSWKAIAQAHIRMYDMLVGS